MDAATLVKVMNAFPASQAILIRGDHGVGKSQLIHQLAAAKGKELHRRTAPYHDAGG